MLVLSRKESESILIGDNIRITIVGRSGGAIRIGVDAPREVRVMRAELVESSPREVKERDSVEDANVSKSKRLANRLSPPKWLADSPSAGLLMPSS